MTGRSIGVAAALLCCLCDPGRAASPGLSPAMTGNWQMTELVCTTCAPSGRLPDDLAGGAIRIGPSSFDDPLAGDCPAPRFSVGPAQTLAVFSGQAGEVAASLRRLAAPDAPVVPVEVTCQPPPHARQPVGATVSLAFIAGDLLVRRWEDGSTIVLQRQALPADKAAPAR